MSAAPQDLPRIKDLQDFRIELTNPTKEFEP
jgi:hypothetical protein